MLRGPGIPSMVGPSVILNAPCCEYSPTNMVPSSPAAKAKSVDSFGTSTLVRRDSRNRSRPPVVPNQTLPSRSSKLDSEFVDASPVNPSLGEKLSAETTSADPQRSKSVRSLRRRIPVGVDIQNVPSRSMKLTFIQPDRGSRGRIQPLPEFVVPVGEYNARTPFSSSTSQRVPSGPCRNLISPPSWISVIA